MRVFEESQTINNLIDNAMEKIKTIVDSSTIIGDEVVTNDGMVIIPISKVTVGYVVGGGEYADLSSRRVANHFPMAAGSSGGMSVTPVGFLIEKNGEVRFINVENKTLYQTILNMFNALMAKIEDDKNRAAGESNASDEVVVDGGYKKSEDFSSLEKELDKKNKGRRWLRKKDK